MVSSGMSSGTSFKPDGKCLDVIFDLRLWRMHVTKPSERQAGIWTWLLMLTFWGSFSSFHAEIWRTLFSKLPCFGKTHTLQSNLDKWVFNSCNTLKQQSLHCYSLRRGVGAFICFMVALQRCQMLWGTYVGNWPWNKFLFGESDCLHAWTLSSCKTLLLAFMASGGGGKENEWRQVRAVAVHLH